jgi:hypothetical protein
VLVGLLEIYLEVMAGKAIIQFLILQPRLAVVLAAVVTQAIVVVVGQVAAAEQL